ncbi:sensory transduction protein lytt [Heliomicrobium modesticaldum Ice1]|uniref:Stage 0 sporulation protein A homolog n=1 Tax=Heliobacterium modesticaldum (strain ATCC 51547 / Ice1) TaxID=498761 RepID=B0TBI1_HELMI|nr:LytTR family DNA-binding domain-containing protein [Heliomicrobium modesticaldum]ABZ85194.1 sensory transduction protein lytt [Heliomicrobium modesticaldum Ice1]
MKVMIAEDEPLSREELEYLLRQAEDVELCPSARNGKELLRLQKEHQPQLIFLDIEMPELNGVEAVRQLAEASAPPLIIFTTAYEQYAVEAFGLRALDYLLKPVDEERLFESLQRARQRLQESAPPKTPISNILLEEGDKLIVVKPERIYYAEKEERRVVIYCDRGRFETRLTMQELQDKLSGHPFVRCHRSFLVNLDYVDEIEPWQNGTYNIILKGIGGTKLPVSRSAAKNVLQRLNG